MPSAATFTISEKTYVGETALGRRIVTRATKVVAKKIAKVV